MESYNDNLHKNANKTLYQYAKELRKNHTEAEDILWQHLRSRKLGGLKFRRQHPLHKYIADFYCNEKKLVIELMEMYILQMIILNMTKEEHRH
jgi:very-short-patch-repair endonuclease